ncbi:hypothetical protein GQ457_01G026470 [Hibiscus cannabinus]
MDDQCDIYGPEVEDIDHVLRTCPQTHMVLQDLIHPYKFHELLSLDIKDWIEKNLTNGAIYARDVINWDLMFSGTCWYIWLHRNSRIFYDQGIDRQPMLKCAQFCLVQMIDALGVSLSVVNPTMG